MNTTSPTAQAASLLPLPAGLNADGATYARFMNDIDRGNPTLNLSLIGSLGRARITVQPVGYWSSDVASLYIARRFEYSANCSSFSSNWTCSMSHSSGGRDTDITKKDGTPNPFGLTDDLDAEANLAQALLDLVAFGRILMQPEHVAVMEAAYQRQQAENEAERQAKKAAEQARIDADPALGVAAAKSMVAQVRAQLTLEKAKLPGWKNCTIEINTFERGKPDTAKAIKAERSESRTTWYLYGTMIGEEALIKKLAEFSHRTVVAA